MIETNGTNLIVEFIKIARPSSTHLNEDEYKIKKTNSFNCWKIDSGKLIKVQSEHVGIIFDEECYIVQWRFDLQLDNHVVKKMLIYYWSGQNAVKASCPLPPDVDKDFPVDRLTQWSEIPLFFHGFQRKCIMLNGKESDFNGVKPHLFIIRGEHPDDIHLYEVPCETPSLRSRTSFLLVNPRMSVFIYWHGYSAIEEYKDYIKACAPHNLLKTWQKDWINFSISECGEGQEPKAFKDALGPFLYDINSAVNMEIHRHWTPKLYYLNNVCGDFTSTEVEYPLKLPNKVSPYPFLQSHLYTALKSAFFLLDNYYDIWLWENISQLNDDSQTMQKMSRDFLNNYHKEKTQKCNIDIKVSIVEAYKEPQEFKQLFPQWRDRH
ncbi:supervillin-like [Rhynchophorus ferrugineus]|uniref:supervillin-like n=1 Tax=Rhynchophorus ferrugineus TaxID=354439 RepID=UPI003FCC7853